MAEQLKNEPVFRLGADPELFVCKSSRPRTIIPVCGLVGGTKSEPVVVDLKEVLGQYQMEKIPVGVFAYQEDTVAYEFNIPATNDSYGFVYAIQDMLAYTERKLREVGLVSKIKAFHQFSRAVLEKAGPQALVFGCDPDFYAYGDDTRKYERDPPKAEDLGGLRFCGGHLHLGYPTPVIPDHIMAKFMDLYVHLPMLWVDKQGERRGIYGLPGLYRPKAYGIEYRSLSPLWLKDMNLCQRIARVCFSLMDDAVKASEALERVYCQVPWDDLQQAVITEDESLANEILQHVQSLGESKELNVDGSMQALWAFCVSNQGRFNMNKEKGG